MQSFKLLQLFSTSLLILLLSLVCSCKGAEKFTENTSSEQRTEIKNNTIAEYPSRKLMSIQLYPLDNPLAPPYLELGSNQMLELRFDDLAGGYENYAFRLIHCNAQWEHTDLPSNNFVQGFPEMTFENAEQSFNTFITYTHYWTSFPNDMMNIILSGNYLVQVFHLDDEETTLCEERFVVYEQLTRFVPQVKDATIIADKRYKQEIDFELLPFNYNMPRPYEDLDIVILQNHRWDNAIRDLQPIYMKGDRFVYDHDEENNFEGLNEYRFLDMKDLRYWSINMKGIAEINGDWHGYMLQEEPRSYDVYRTLPDLNGNYLIKNDLFDHNLESQYITNHFRLKLAYPLVGSKVCVVGKAFGYDCTDENTLTFNAQKKEYEGNILMKQGYYNYMYGVQPTSEMIDIKTLEGSHFETSNEYTIIAYYADPNGYDRVVGILFTDNNNR